MKQSRVDSLMESVCNVLLGLVIAFAANMVVIPWVTGVPLSIIDNLWLSGFFTILSIVRSYTVRRVFNGRSIWESIRS